MKRILWISWHPNPYNDFLFQQISQQFQLEVIFIKTKLATHPWEKQPHYDFGAWYWSEPGMRLAILQRLLFREYSLRVVAGWDHPLMLLSLIWNSGCVRTFCIWTDTPNPDHKRTGWKKFFHSTLIRLFVRRAKAILVTGETGVKNFRQIFPKANHAVNFPFATDLNFFKPGAMPRSSSVFITVGRMVNSHKGMDVALRAVASLRKKSPDLKFCYVLIGTGPDRQELVQYISENRLTDYVVVKDWMEPIDMLHFYQTSSFLVHPSHFDPFPNTVLEAMACGLPVIGSTAAGSVLDRVVPNQCGLWFQDGDSEELAKGIELLLTNPNLAEAWGREARKVAECWSVDFNIKTLTKVIDEI